MKWIVGVSIVAAVLGWAGTMTIPAATITPDEATLKYFPPETQGIAFVDVAALRNASLIQNAMGKEQLQSVPPGLKEFMDKTGFDVRRDVDRVTVGKISTFEKLAVADARFDKFKAEQFLRDKGKEAETYLGRAVYRDGDTAITFLDGVILFGSENAVKQAIDRMTYPGSPQLGNDLLKAIKTIEAGNQVWAVGNFSQEDLPATGLRESTPAAQILKSLRGGTYQMSIDSGVHARATGNFTDAESAGNTADMARGLIAVAKLQVAKQQPDLLKALDGIQVSSSGSSVVVRIEEPGDLLMKLQTTYRPTFERRLE
jgi:hypothetical protein